MHEKFLLAALEQARLNRGVCAPNPCVGAVAVQNANIIAQASHQGAGSPHAEQLLSAQLRPKMPGLSLYITLEPCNHWGKTPPCVDAIIEYGVEQVFFSYKDPNPLVAQNNSTAKLHEHGIKVRHIPLKEINEFYQSYSYWTKTAKPRVAVKMAHTLDGKIGQSVGDRLILSNELCSHFTHELRAASDVVLTSARTIQLDNPRMNVRLDNKEQAKPVAIIDRHLNLNRNAAIFGTASHCHVYHHSTKEASYSNSSYHLTPLKNGALDLQAIVSHLGDLGFHDVLVEAGGAVFSSLHQQGLVHKTYLYLVPKVLGQDAITAYQKNELFNRPHKISWQAMGDNMIACLDWQEEECLLD